MGMVLIGYRHFDNVHTGVAAACLYLMLPYTAQTTPLGGSRGPGGAAGLGRRGLSPPAGGRILLGMAGGRDLLSALSLAAVVQFLLAARPDPLHRSASAWRWL